MRLSPGQTWVSAVVAVGVVGFLAFRPTGQAVPRPAPPAAVVSPLHAAPEASVHLTCTFWNLEWFPGRRPKAGVRAQATHVAAVLPVIQKLDPDVLGLEEVGDADAARLVTDALPGGYRVDACTEFTREPTGEPSRQQIVLCSRLPLLAAGWQKWAPDSTGRAPRRGFAFAAYRPAPGEVLLVYGLHLKSNLADEPGGDATNTAMREESMRQLLVHEQQEVSLCAQWGRVRLVLVGGDMNTSLDDGRFAAETTLRALHETGGFRWAWEGIPLALRLTLPGGGPYPATCFDHVFYHGDGARLMGASIQFAGRTASDHRPVTAKFEW